MTFYVEEFEEYVTIPDEEYEYYVPFFGYDDEPDDASGESCLALATAEQIV